jgi:polyhydroxybutyrate depolymerase
MSIDRNEASEIAPRNPERMLLPRGSTRKEVRMTFRSRSRRSLVSRSPRVLALVAGLALLGAGGAQAAWVTVDAGRGPVSVQVPPGVSPSNPAPLAILLHGYGGTGAIYEWYLDLADRLLAGRFLYALPDGVVDQDGKRYWNATDACCNVYDVAVDDVGYLAALIDEIDDLHGVSEVHLLGYSNGGFMAYRMACDRPELLTSIVSMAGATWNEPAQCTPSEPVRVLEVHGTEDSQIVYEGGIWRAGQAPHPGAEETVAMWAGYNGCTTAPTNLAAFDADSTLAGAETTRVRFQTGCGQEFAALWTIEGAEHLPTFTNTFRDRLVAWLGAEPSAPTAIFLDGFEGGFGTWDDAVGT